MSDRATGIVSILITSILLLAAVSSLIQKHNSSAGIDFYNLWGIGYLLKQGSTEELTPYTRQKQFADALFRDAAKSADQSFSSAAKFWRSTEQRGEFVASPVLYLLFSMLPTSYETAFSIYNSLQALAFLLAFVLAGRLFCQRNLFYVTWLALLLMSVPAPLQSDLHVGNIGSFQLLALVVLALYAESFFDDSASKNISSFWSRSIFLALVLSLLLIKLNLLIPLTLFLVYFFVRHKGNPGIFAVLLGIAIAAVFACSSCYYFRSGSIWIDWFSFAFFSDPPRLMIPFSEGNLSIVAALRDYNVRGTTLLVSLLSASLFFVFWIAYTRLGGGRKALERILTVSFGNPHWALATGVAATVVLSPIMWFHYYVIVYAPAIWLLAAPKQPSFNRIMGALAIFLLSDSYFLVQHLVKPGIISEYWAALTVMSSWLPLWIGILAFVRRHATPVDPEGELAVTN